MSEAGTEPSQATPAQLRVLRAIARGIQAGLPPTYVELCSELGMTSTNAVACHLRRLETKGLLARGVRRARDLRLTSRGLQALSESLP